MRKFIIQNLLIIILILSAGFRLWKLDINPPHLSPDEAALGYNAYSIMKTGRDEYGEVLPIIFKSFGDFKPGLYVYLAVPTVAIFGLNEWSVRLPSAVAGIVAVFLLYLIAKELIRLKFTHGISGEILPLSCAFALAISPWHIQFSRGAWEINVSLTLTLVGIYFFLKSVNSVKFLVYSAIFFGLTLITYQGAKLSTLIVLLVITLVFYKEILNIVKRNAKVVIFSVIVALVISSPVFLSFNKGQTGRLKVFSVFSYPRPKEYLEKMLQENNEKTGDINYYLFHSELLNFNRGILGRYFNHFSARFLFFDGDYQNPKHSSPNHGMLMMFDIILLPVGLVGLIRSKGRMKYLFILWLLLSPLPAVLTRDQVQAVRAFNMVIPTAFVSAYGLVKIYEVVSRAYKKSRTLGFAYFGLILVVLVLSLIYFMDSYFIHMPVHNAKYWNYGYKQVIEKLLPIQGNYKTIYFQQSYNQPYIYYLFYSKYEPRAYQKQANLSYYLGPDVGLVEKIDNIKFSGWSWPYATGDKLTLIIGNSVAIPSDFNPKDYNLISEIKYPDNFMTAFRILESK